MAPSKRAKSATHSSSKSPSRKATTEAAGSAAPTATTAESDWKVSESSFSNFFMPLFLVVVCPIFFTVVAFISTSPDLAAPTATAFAAFAHEQPRGWVGAIMHCWQYCGVGTPAAWGFLFVFNFTSLMLFWWPGKTEYGPITADGHTPEYMDNGVAHCVLFTGMFFGASTQVGDYFGYTGWYSITIFWDNYAGTIGALNTFGLLFCVLLYVKGLHFPTKNCKGTIGDCGTSGKGILMDYYWGMELYPRFFNVDVKKFVNDRFSMTYWMLSGVSFCFASKEKHGTWDYGQVFCALSQFLYLCKFFWWEMGYMRSIDIIADRAGFYETWGCLVYVPSLYTLHTRLMVNSPSNLSFTSAALIFTIGMLGVALNFWADMQVPLPFLLGCHLQVLTCCVRVCLCCSASGSVSTGTGARAN